MWCPEQIEGLWKYILIYGGSILATAGSVLTFVYFAGKVEMGVTHDIRENGFDKLSDAVLFLL